MWLRLLFNPIFVENLISAAQSPAYIALHITVYNCIGILEVFHLDFVVVLIKKVF